MAFINDNDYSVLVRNEIKSILQENYTETKLRSAENMAIAQVKNYLKGRYDVEAIFSEAAPEEPEDEDSRNHHIVMITLDCALYHLYTSTVPKRMPEIRSLRYQDALNWLRDVGKGDVTADLPVIKDDEGNDMLGVIFSSKYPKDDHKW